MRYTEGVLARHGVVDALKHHLSRVDSVVLVAVCLAIGTNVCLLHNFVNRQCHLGEDASRTLDIGTGVVVDQLLDNRLVIRDIGSLKHLLCTRKRCHRCYDSIALGSVGLGVGSLMTEVYIELTKRDICHRAYTAHGLEVESRYKIVNKRVRVLEGSWIFVILLNNLRAIVLVERNANVRHIVASLACALVDIKVGKSVNLVGLECAARSDIVLLWIEVRVELLSFFNRL